MARFTLPSFAKINPYLRVLGRRPDGLHELFTVFQTVSLHDTITFSNADRLRLTCSDPEIPTDERNLIFKAAALLNRSAGADHGASIELDKRIPSPGGLGGGSSNAAVALIGLSRLWGLEMTLESLLPIARELGSDVPFFLFGGTAIGTGTGGEIEDCLQLDMRELLIVKPLADVPTPLAYSLMKAENLTSDARERILSVCRSECEKLEFGHSMLLNDLEPSVFAEFPEVRRVSERLKELEAVSVLMSGSGASVFAVFDNKETRQTAEKALDEEVNWRKFAVAAVSRNEYREKVYGRP